MQRKSLQQAARKAALVFDDLAYQTQSIYLASISADLRYAIGMDKIEIRQIILNPIPVLGDDTDSSFTGWMPVGVEKKVVET